MKIKNITRTILSLMVLAPLVLVAACAGGTGSSPSPTSPKPKTYSKPPAMTIDTSKQYIATMETAKGKIVIDLFAKDTPVTVNNFVFLAREGFYDGTKFHRVIADFMIQGGDPTGTGAGGPGYKFADEFTSHKNIVGSLSMANSGKNTNGSQFFIITTRPQPHLDGVHTVFGQVTQGLDIANQIKQGDTLIKVTIQEK